MKLERRVEKLPLMVDAARSGHMKNVNATKMDHEGAR